MQKLHVDKEWKKARNDSGLATGESQEQIGGHTEGTKRQTESSLCYIDGHMSSQKCGTRADISEVQRSSRTLRRHRKKRIRSLRRIH